MNDETLFDTHTDIDSGFDIYIKVSGEIDAPDFDFGDAKEMKRFESGELLNLCIRVVAFKNGIELGSDCLGQCFVNANDTSNDIQEIVKEHGMIEAAIEEATETLKGLVR